MMMIYNKHTNGLDMYYIYFYIFYIVINNYEMLWCANTSDDDNYTDNHTVVSVINTSTNIIYIKISATIIKI